MRLLLILPIILIGCAPSIDSNHDGSISGIDPAFNSCYQKFGQQFNMNVGIPIGFRPQSGFTVSECKTYSDGYKDIEVDPDFWASIDADTQCELIDHELGHCVFNRLHSRGILNDGCPASIMYPNVFGDPCFSLHLSEYMQELPHRQPGDYL